MFQILRLADFFIIHGVSGFTLLKLVGLLLLSFLPMALPVSFLIAVLIGFGRLSADSELVAMKSSGISIFRMALPVTALSLAIVALSLTLNLEWVPWGENAFKSTITKLGNTKAASSIKEGTFTSGFFDLLIFTDKVDNKTGKLKHVFIYDERQPKNPFTVIGQEGEIVPVESDSELGTAAILKLYKGSIHRNDLNSDSYQKIDFDQYRVFLEIGEGEDTSTIKPKRLSYRQLIERIRASNDPQALTELWRRFSVAMSPLIFVFLGIGFGTIRTRSARASAILVALAVILVYWGLQAFATGLAYSGKLHPMLAMQAPNFVVLIGAVWSFRKAAW